MKSQARVKETESDLVAAMDELWHEVRLDPERSAEAARMAYRRARAAGWKRAMASALIVAGGANTFMLRVEEAFSDLLEALSLASEADAPREAGRVYLRMAALDNSIGDYSAAFDDAEKCVAMARKAGDASLEAAALNNIGEVFRELGRYGDAIEQYERAMHLARQGGDPRATGLYAGNRGMALQSLGRLDEAMRDYEEAEASFRAYHVYPGLVEIGCRRAELASAKGDFFSAEASYREALALAAAHTLVKAECDVLIEYGAWLVERDRRAEAEAKLRRAVDLASASRSRKLRARAFRQLSRLAAIRGEHRSAFMRLDMADRLERRLFDTDVQARLAAFKVRYDLAWAERSALSARVETEDLKRQNREIARSIELSRLVSRMGRAVTAELDLADACRELYEGVRRFVDAPTFALAVYEPEGRSLRYRLIIEGGRDLRMDDDLLADPLNVTAYCFRERREIIANSRAQMESLHSTRWIGADNESLAFLPVLDGAEALGVMTVQSPRPGAYDDAAITALRGLSLFVAIAIKNGLRYEIGNAKMEAEIFRLRNIELKAKGEELKRALDEVSEYALREKEYKEMILAWNKRLEDQVKLRTRELEQLAMSDGLTGLYNRRHAFELLERELSASIRYGRSLSVLMADIDDFKGINDAFGHRAGDAVLADIARAIKSALRATDFAGRYGGEEFLVVLPETPAEGAAILAERIRAIVAEAEPLDGMDRTVTLSIGVAALEDPTDSLSLVELADCRLYEAKRGGKNRVVSA